MLPPLDYLEHQRVCSDKQLRRAARILALPSHYHSTISTTDRYILSKPISNLVQDVQGKRLNPIEILRCYGKIALRAHEKTNCLTELMLPEAETWIKEESINLDGPLAGIPISLKDSITVKGFDVSVGYSVNCGNPCTEDGALVKILKAAGAVPYVKTNLPTSLLSFESSNDVWGRCLNPHNAEYSPGGSTGGEAALLACGGRIGIGSDVAGSVRVPAHFSGIYSLRCSTGRWPKMGMKTSTPGQEGVPSVFSPMARTLDDLDYFTRSILSMECWRWDHSVHPMAWRSEMFTAAMQKPKFKIGVMRTDGVVPPSPACARALDQTVEALRSQGHECVDINPPSPYEGLQLASQLLTADGCRTFLSFLRTGETNDPGAQQMAFYMKLPGLIKNFFLQWVTWIRRDSIWAGLLSGWYEKSSFEQWPLVARREAFKARWHDWWNEEDFDALLTPVNATPAVPHGGMKDAVSSCGYTFLFNLLDYSCGVLPVLKVDGKLDMLPANSHDARLNGVAAGAYNQYDAEKMHGLPVGVQIVGRRLEEEKVLALMARVEEALHKVDCEYELLDVN